jgi:hypothetical protein
MLFLPAGINKLALRELSLVTLGVKLTPDDKASQVLFSASIPQVLNIPEKSPLFAVRS